MYNIQFIDNSPEVDVQSEYLISKKNLIEQAIMYSISATFNVTENYPKSARGTTLYNEVISNLRDIFHTEGFERWYVNNIELTVSKELRIAFYFCRGDEQTGIKTALSPLSLRKKGKITQQILGLKSHNDMNYEMFPETVDINSIEKPEITIWAVTIFADFINDTYRAELGVPLSVNHKGYIDNFDRRIMLDISNTPTPNVTEKPIEFTDGFDIDISQNEQIAA